MYGRDVDLVFLIVHSQPGSALSLTLVWPIVWTSSACGSKFQWLVEICAAEGSIPFVHSFRGSITFYNLVQG